MANWAGPSSGDDRRSEHFLTGRPSDRDWMEMKRVRPRWSGHETLNTMDSGIGYIQDLYGPAHALLIGCKRRADDDSLLIPSAEAPDSEEYRGMPHINDSLSRRAQIVPPREVGYRRPDRYSTAWKRSGNIQLPSARVAWWNVESR